MAQLLPIQTQPFTLYGNGCVIGNTSVILTSFNDIDGNPISFQGTIMTGTIEPSSGSNEEQIVFTGLTRNSNGTVTLTGVSSVTFASPYTQTSGVLKSHFGNTTFTLSDTAFLYSQYASLGANNTFTGTDTFVISPIIPTVSSSQTNQAASVGYVNAIAISGSPKATSLIYGISRLSTAPTLASDPIAVADDDLRVPTLSQAQALPGDGGVPSSSNLYVTQQGLQNGSEFYALTTGSSTAYAISYSPTPSGYVTGELIKFKSHVASGISPTINKNSLGAKSLYKMISSGTTALSIADLGTNQMCVAEYDGGGYQLISSIANVSTLLGLFKNGSTTHDISTTTTNTIPHGLGVIPKNIIISFTYNGTAGNIAFGTGSYNGTTISEAFVGNNSGTSLSATGADTTNIITALVGSSQSNIAVPTFDATNITLTWTKTGSPTGTINISWQAQA